MKKLNWKKNEGENLQSWVAVLKPLRWQLSIRQNTPSNYSVFINYGQGENVHVLPNVEILDLIEAKEVCAYWIHDTIKGLQRWQNA